jgi:arylsulfatase A-like enzyme
VPSRAGVLSGRYQQKIGVEQNGDPSMALSVVTIPERLKEAGYVSCQVGKWHLDNPEGRNVKVKEGDSPKPIIAYQPKDQGFDEYYNGQMNIIQASHDFMGNKLETGKNRITDDRFRCVWQADAGMQFIKRHANKDPFFLYLAFFAPHVPLESPEPWFSKTPTSLPLQRRQALAMIAAMDEGIGNIRKLLAEQGIDKNTLIFFIGDNGAPLRPAAWNGSLNLPLVGEKGMLTDGGIRTPFVAAWPGTLPAGKVYDTPVSSLDVAATAVSIAGLPKAQELDGVNLIPFVQGKQKGVPHQDLFWRWRSQGAVLSGKYKFIMVGPNEKYLFDVFSPEGEVKNLLTALPKVSAALETKLLNWNSSLPSPSLPRVANKADESFFDTHVKKIVN